MTKLMQLRCTVSESDIPRTLIVRSTMFDGTPFSLKIDALKVKLNEEITSEKPVVEGWLPVEQVGEQFDRVAIVLPAPTIEFGKNVSVHAHQLLPLHVSIQDFIK